MEKISGADFYKEVKKNGRRTIMVGAIKMGKERKYDVGNSQVEEYRRLFGSSESERQTQNHNEQMISNLSGR